MKLCQSDLKSLANYFKKIESLAERMGMDVDDLIDESKNRRASMSTSFRKNLNSAIQKNRALYFAKLTGSKLSREFSGVKMKLLTKLSK